MLQMLKREYGEPIGHWEANGQHLYAFEQDDWLNLVVLVNAKTICLQKYIKIQQFMPMQRENLFQLCDGIAAFAGATGGKFATVDAQYRGSILLSSRLPEEG